MSSRNLEPLANITLDLHLLRSFVVIVESGTMMAAASKLHRTPAALSQQLKRLETQLGCTLLQRNPRGVSATAAGDTLMIYARRLLQLQGEALQELRGNALSGELKLGTPDDVGTRVLPHLIARCRENHPQLAISIQTSSSKSLIAQVQSGAVDLALITMTEQSGTTPLAHEVIHSESLIWVQKHNSAIAKQEIIPVAAAQPGCVWRSRSLGALEAQRRPYRIAVICDHCAGQEAAVQADIAIAALPASLVRPPLQQVPSEYGLPHLGQYQIGIIMGEPQSQAALGFAQLLKDEFSQFAGQLNPRHGGVDSSISGQQWP